MVSRILTVPLTTPLTKVIKHTITTIEIIIDKIVLFQSADIYVIMKDIDVVATLQLTIEGDDYAKWGSDDSYIVDYVISKIQE